MCKWIIKQRYYIRCQFLKNYDVNKKNSKYSNFLKLRVLFNSGAIDV